MLPNIAVDEALLERLSSQPVTIPHDVENLENASRHGDGGHPEDPLGKRGRKKGEKKDALAVAGKPSVEVATPPEFKGHEGIRLHPD